jgi:hypothetical protein
MKLGYHFRRPFLYNLPVSFIFLIYAAFEVIGSTNSHTRHSNLPEPNKVLMVHDSAGTCLKYSKYGAFTLLCDIKIKPINDNI